MPVSSSSVVGFCWAKEGASRWMDHRSAAFTSPFSSMGWPSTLNIRPSTPSPTGASMVRPWPVTAAPRPSPSLGESMMQRTVSPPTCWATSITCSFPSISTVSASLISGRLPPSKATSTTGPSTCATVPFRSIIHSSLVRPGCRRPKSAPSGPLSCRRWPDGSPAAAGRHRQSL